MTDTASPRTQPAPDSTAKHTPVEPPANPRRTVVVITCEHGGCELPPEHAALFTGHGPLLRSHRGWDPGSLELGRQLARATGAPLHAATTTRLLVDLNRSIGHRQLFSEVTRVLPMRRRQQILAQHYRPHRDAVERQIAQHVAGGARVVHVAAHSFTPSLDGIERRADVAWLYDPQRPGERAFAAAWMRCFALQAPALRLRRNHPYRGRSDGLTAMLRKHHPDAAYLGIELEVNQRLVRPGGAAWRNLCARLASTLAEVVASVAPDDRP